MDDKSAGFMANGDGNVHGDHNHISISYQQGQAMEILCAEMRRMRFRVIFLEQQLEKLCHEYEKLDSLEKVKKPEKNEDFWII